MYKFPTCLCSYCCYLLTIVILLLFQNQKFNCNTIFTWMNYPACLVSLVSFVKLQLIIRLCNLSNVIIDNYSFQRKRVNCSKVSGYQQRNTDQRGPSDSGTTHYSLRRANIWWFEENDNRHHWWFYNAGHPVMT